MTAHTPGPWSYHHEPTLNRHIVRAGFAGERNICVDYGAGLKSYEAAANARLIAAAPDMLAALKAAARVLAGEEMTKGGLIRALDLTRAAIAKAKGGKE